MSDEIGKRFSTNGDVLGFSYNGDKKANSVGVETNNMTSAEPPGPCITSVMDFRKLNGGSFENNFVIEDGTPPSILSIPFAVGVSFSAKVIGIDKYPANELLEKTFQVRTLTTLITVKRMAPGSSFLLLNTTSLKFVMSITFKPTITSFTERF